MFIHRNSACLVLTTLSFLMVTRSVLAADGPRVEAVRVPDGGTYPQALTDGKGRVHLVYAKGDPMRADVYYVRSDDGAKTFTKPLRINSHPRSVIITGTVRGPHLALGKDDRPHVAWMGSDEAQPRFEGKKTPMLYTRLNDAGDAFEPQRNVIQQRPGLDGGGSVAADKDGNVYVAWHAPNGAEGEENRDVWITRSRDDGKTFDVETAVLPKKVGICGCCGMRIHAGDEGRVFIVVRSAEEMVNRDIHLLASDDHGKSFRIAAVDPWNVGKCVMSTASLGHADGRLLAVWETKDQVKLASINPASRGSVAMMQVAGIGKHPSLAMNGRGDFVVAWGVGTGWNKGGAVAWRVFDQHGTAISSQTGREEGLPVWSVPAVIALPDGRFKVIY